MERLTEYHCGVAVIKDKKKLKDAMQKLANYEDLEEQGLLLRLPCKVGDDIWFCAREVLQCKVKNINLSKHGILITIEYNGENELLNLWSTVVCVSDLGETAFLTKAEAEKKLAEMEK